MPAPSHRPGLGANAYDGGVSFRFWAPFANSVEIIGIGTWTPPGIALASEGNGYWSADINGITMGQKCKVLVNGLWRMDPRARDVTSSTGNCIVDNTSFAWKHDFGMPGWNRAYPEYRVGFPRAGQWWVRFNSDWNGYSPDFGNFHSYDTTADGSALQNMPFRQHWPRSLHCCHSLSIALAAECSV